MVRTQIQLTDEQAERLRQLARESSLSMAELIRRAVERLLASASRPSDQDVRARAIAAAGRFRSGVSDLAERHDDYLAETIEP